MNMYRRFMKHLSRAADGDETILQRWRTLATNKHGGNTELKNLNPKASASCCSEYSTQ